jgi:hypothetical protein
LKSPKIWVSIPASENVADKPSPVIRKAPLEQRSAAARLIQLGDAGPGQLKCSELTTKKKGKWPDVMWFLGINYWSWVIVII